jgi:dGTPase
MAERLKRSNGELAFPLDEDVAEAGGLSHDLGHPPFGHSTEHTLNLLALPFGGFEGNAQSFRAVTKLPLKQRAGSDGLDLSRATLNACLKYPLIGPGCLSPSRRWQDIDEYSSFSAEVLAADWDKRHYGRKWGAYPTETEDFVFARDGSAEFIRCPEAILIDWADDISYAVHDIQDFFRAGMIPLDRLEPDASALTAGLSRRLGHLPNFDHGRISAALETVFGRLKGIKSYEDSRADVADLSRLASTLISYYERSVTTLTMPPYIRIDEEVQYEVEVLKHLTWHYVIERPQLAASQLGQERVIRTTFFSMLEWLQRDPSNRRLPKRLRDYHVLSKREFEVQGGKDQTLRAVQETREGDLEDNPASWVRHLRDVDIEHTAPCVRAVIDFIAGLTERQLLDLYRRLAGDSDQSMFSAWFA